jgi:hypothetical protein
MPWQVASSELTLAEIGAIFCLKSLEKVLTTEHDEDQEKRISARLTDPEFQAIVESMKKRKLVSIKVSGKALAINVDLRSIT